MAHEQMVLYTSTDAQWTYVAHLALEEKGYSENDYVTKQLSLMNADNFDAEYLAINPNGTVPSLTAKSLAQPLTESRDILNYLDSQSRRGRALWPENPQQKAKISALIDLVHRPELSTDLILLHARNEEELDAKRKSPWRTFLSNRQDKLAQSSIDHPELSSFYDTRLNQNGYLYNVYTDLNTSLQHETFFRESSQGYKHFADGLVELDSLLTLPYAAGEEITAADLHVGPWLAHAMWGAGGEEVDEFEPLERLIQRSVPGFKIGQGIKRWWTNVSASPSFKKLYPRLH